mmetsp:Transcript_105518/g.275524  ORF Transcript_105518/g.275524 Transcript_105518/m.275524 type:complete len:204 (-) Transcript_105518:255-866(-)
MACAIEIGMVAVVSAVVQEHRTVLEHQRGWIRDSSVPVIAPSGLHDRFAVVQKLPRPVKRLGERDADAAVEICGAPTVGRSLRLRLPACPAIPQIQWAIVSGEGLSDVVEQVRPIGCPGDRRVVGKLGEHLLPEAVWSVWVLRDSVVDDRVELPAVESAVPADERDEHVVGPVVGTDNAPPPAGPLRVAVPVGANVASLPDGQ